MWSTQKCHFFVTGSCTAALGSRMLPAGSSAIVFTKLSVGTQYLDGAGGEGGGGDVLGTEPDVQLVFADQVPAAGLLNQHIFSP